MGSGLLESDHPNRHPLTLWMILSVAVYVGVNILLVLIVLTSPQ